MRKIVLLFVLSCFLFSCSDDDCKECDTPQGIILENNKLVSIGTPRRVEFNIFPSTTAPVEISFESSNTEVATVSSEGIIQGKSTGETVISATLKSTGFTDRCEVEVINDTVFDFGSNIGEIQNFTVRNSKPGISDIMKIRSFINAEFREFSVIEPSPEWIDLIWVDSLNYKIRYGENPNRWIRNDYIRLQQKGTGKVIQVAASQLGYYYDQYE
jgi:Bacterial Ig-like domain (group 2).